MLRPDPFVIGLQAPRVQVESPCVGEDLGRDVHQWGDTLARQVEPGVQLASIAARPTVGDGTQSGGVGKYRKFPLDTAPIYDFDESVQKIHRDRACDSFPRCVRGSFGPLCLGGVPPIDIDQGSRIVNEESNRDAHMEEWILAASCRCSCADTLTNRQSPPLSNR